MKLPEVGDVYRKGELPINGYLTSLLSRHIKEEKYVKVTKIVYVRGSKHIEFLYLGTTSTYHYNIDSFIIFFTYIMPEKYDNEIKRLLDEDIIRDIIE